MNHLSNFGNILHIGDFWLLIRNCLVYSINYARDIWLNRRLMDNNPQCWWSGAHDNWLNIASRRWIISIILGDHCRAIWHFFNPVALILDFAFGWRICNLPRNLNCVLLALGGGCCLRWIKAMTSLQMVVLIEGMLT